MSQTSSFQVCLCVLLSNCTLSAAPACHTPRRPLSLHKPCRWLCNNMCTTFSLGDNSLMWLACALLYMWSLQMRTSLFAAFWKQSMSSTQAQRQPLM